MGFNAYRDIDVYDSRGYFLLARSTEHYQRYGSGLDKITLSELYSGKNMLPSAGRGILASTMITMYDVAR